MHSKPGMHAKENVEPAGVEQFAYFMIRVRRTSLASPECSLSGMVELLATGEKESFASGEELIRIVCHQPDAIHKIGWQPEPSDTS